VASENRAQKLTRSATGNVTIILMLVLVGAFMALPLVYVVVSAFKPLEEIFMFPPRFFVRRPTLNNFVLLLQLVNNLRVPFSRYLFNSIFVSIAGTFAHVVLASMAAYPLSKLNIRGGKIIFSIIVAALLFNGVVLSIPQYIIMAKMGILNTYWAYILPFLPSAMGLFLMKQFMETMIPDTIIEAAKIDGASHWKIFWRIVMPNVKPAWLTLAIFAFQGIWNNQGGGIIFDEQLKMLPAALSQIAAGGIARVGVGMAAALILMIPPIIFFVISQSKVIQTMSHSGIK
jgi:putative chitobiose transport system permease protein